MSSSMYVDVEKSVERLKDHFPQIEEYKLDYELSQKNGKYAALKIQNENPVLNSIYVLISQHKGVLLRFGDLVLCCEYPEVDGEVVNVINLILSDKLAAMVNYENIVYMKSQVARFTRYFIIDDSKEKDDSAQLNQLMEDLKQELGLIKRMFNKYRGITVIYNWSGSLFERYER